MSGSLDGLRVVEVATEIDGPYCTKLLVDLGADVVKVEAPHGDPLRAWAPLVETADGGRHSGLFEYLNAGKRACTLDLDLGLDNDSAADELRALIAGADMLVENLGGQRTTWRLDSAALHEINPDLVVVRVSDFGTEGPLRDREMTALTLQAAAGWVNQREFDRPPVQAGARIPEYITGAYAALGGLTALRLAHGATRPVEVDVSAFEALLSTLPYPMLLAERLKSMGLPPNSKAGPMLGIVRAADGWIGINCLTGQHWLDVCAMMGLPDFEEHQLSIMLGGPEREEFFAKAQPWLDAMTVADIVDLSQAMRIPAAPVTDGATILDCPQYADRGFFLSVPADAGAGAMKRPGAPFRLSLTPACPPRPAPSLGENAAPTWTPRDEPWSAAPVSSAELPFDGLKVFDLSTFWAGAYLTCYLGALGADVVKLESIQRPDGHRYSGALLREGDDWYERGPLWQGTNLNKRDLTLDLSSEDGRRLAVQLASEADVIVENFSPRVVEQFGLDYESVAAVNPSVIMVRMPGFGLEGPWRDFVGWALNIEQLSGMAAATGYPDGPPCNLQGPADPIAGVHAAVALLAALEHRGRSGEGQLIEVAQIEVGAAVTAQPVIEHSVTGQVPARDGNRHCIYAQGVYQTAVPDEWVAVSVRHDDDWAAVCDLAGRPELQDDPRFVDTAARRRHHDEFDEVLSAWLAAEQPDRAADALSARNVPGERLMTSDRMYSIEQLDARGFYDDLTHPITGAHRYPGWPFRISPGPSRHHRSAPPTLGEHNAQVLGSLGLSADDIADLENRKVIGQRILNA
ncbi:CoA transferase [Mycolicibacterium sp. 3033]|nr:CoA transferase [Mycolicibacterium aurantiacum]